MNSNSDTNCGAKFSNLNTKYKVAIAFAVIGCFCASFVPALYQTKRTVCLRDCDETAECGFSDEYDQYVCICKDGYVGNHISGCLDVNECEE